MNKNNQFQQLRAAVSQLRSRASDELLDEKSMSTIPIKGRIKPKIEMHYIDLAQTSYGADTTGTVTALNLSAEGTDNVSRLGRKVITSSVAVKGFAMVPPNGVLDTPQQARVLLVWDNAAAGALPAITDILTAVNSTSFLNVNNVARFTILHDQVYSLGINFEFATESVADRTIIPIDITLRVNSPTQYDGTAAAITSIQNGSLLLITTGSQANAVGSSAVAVLSTRVTFTDVM